MRHKHLYILLAALFLAKALLFCVILRPWLGPDEAIRLEYARLFAGSGLKTLIPAVDVANEAEILRSMTLFQAWKFMDLPSPGEAGQRRFQDSPLQKDTASTTYPPLFYLVLGNLWRAAGIDALLPQLYTGRLLSMIFGVVQLAVLIHLARRVWPLAGTEVRLCAVVFMAFQPQWTYLTSSIHSDNWSNMLSAVLLLLGLIIMEGPDPRRGVSGPPVSGRRFYLQHGVLLAVVLVLMALSTRATAIMGAILFLAAGRVILQKIRSDSRRHRLALLLAALALCLAAGVFALVFQQGRGLYGEWEEALGRGLMQRGAYIPPNELGTLISHYDKLTPGNVIRSMFVVFSTFWLALGTLVYKLSVGWLLALALLSSACLAGWFKDRLVWREVWGHPAWFLLWVAPITTLGAVFYLYGPHQKYAPEGRYLLLVMPAVAMLVTEGWRRCFGVEVRRTAMACWLCGWLLLDGIVLFQYVIPLYYLQ